MSSLTRWEPTARWNPFRELEEMEKRLSSLFGRTQVPTGGDKKEAITVAEWSPLVDISEDEKEYVIKAEVPEMKKKRSRSMSTTMSSRSAESGSTKRKKKGRNITASSGRTAVSCGALPFPKMPTDPRSMQSTKTAC